MGSHALQAPTLALFSEVEAQALHAAAFGQQYGGHGYGYGGHGAAAHIGLGNAANRTVVRVCTAPLYHARPTLGAVPHKSSLVGDQNFSIHKLNPHTGSIPVKNAAIAITSSPYHYRGRSLEEHGRIDRVLRHRGAFQSSNGRAATIPAAVATPPRLWPRAQPLHLQPSAASEHLRQVRQRNLAFPARAASTGRYSSKQGGRGRRAAPAQSPLSPKRGGNSQPQQQFPFTNSVASSFGGHLAEESTFSQLPLPSPGRGGGQTAVFGAGLQGSFV